MNDQIRCPQCGSDDVAFRPTRKEYHCEGCHHGFQPAPVRRTRRVFLSYGHDAHASLAEQLYNDLTGRGHTVWIDGNELRAGMDWEHRIEQGLNSLRESQPPGCVVLLMTPHAVRLPDGYCLNELARAIDLRIEIIPVMAARCVQPLSINRLQYLDMRDCVPPSEHAERYQEQLDRLLKCVSGEMALEGEGGQARLMACLAPISFDAERQQHVPAFTGRTWLFEEVDAWLRDASASRVFWITGPPGIGKSAIASALQARRPEVAAFHLCRFGDSEKADPRRAVLSLAYQLSTQLEEYRRRLLDLPLESIVKIPSAETLFDRVIVQPFWGDYPTPDRPVVVLIDALDEATRDGRNELAEFLARQIPNTPPWLRLILTSRSEVEVVSALSSFDPHIIDAASKENLDDLRAYVRQRLAPTEVEAPVLERALDAIVERSAGNFLYAAWICQELAAGRLSMDRPTDFPRGLSEVYLSDFRRRFPDVPAYKTAVRPALQMVAAAREPLPTALISEQLHWGEQDTEDFRHAVGSLFPERDGAVRSFHRSVMEWLTNRDLAGQYFVSERDGQRALAGLGWAEFKRRALSPYFERHLAAHLADIEDFQRLEEALADHALFMKHSDWSGRYTWMGYWRLLNDGRLAPDRYKDTLGVLETSGESPEGVARFADRVGAFLDEMGLLVGARPFIQRALEWREAHLDKSHPDVLESLRRLAESLRRERRFDDARPLYEQALTLLRTTGPDRLGEVATTLHAFGELHHDIGQAKRKESARLMGAVDGIVRAEVKTENDVVEARRAFEEAKRAFGESERAYADAQTAYDEALQIEEGLLSPDDPEIARSVNDLAVLHYEQDHNDVAMSLFERAERIFTRALGAAHLEVSVAQFGQARIYKAQGDLARAWPLFLRALEGHERMFPSSHDKVLTCRKAVDGVLGALDPPARRQAFVDLVGARERAYGRQHPETVRSCDAALGAIERAVWQAIEARDAQTGVALAKQALAIAERIHGPDHAMTAFPLNGLARSLQELERFDEALKPAERALTIRKHTVDIEPQLLAVSLNNYGLLLVEIGRTERDGRRFDEAEPILRRCLTVDPKATYANYWLGRLYELRARPRDAAMEAAAWRAFLAGEGSREDRRAHARRRLEDLGQGGDSLGHM